MPSRLIVLKFGSSVLRTDDDLPEAVHEVYREVRRGRRVVAVVSAIGRTTNELLERGRQAGGECHDQASAALLATGERAAAALLAITLDRAGVPSAVLDPLDIGLTAQGPRLAARPVSVDEVAIRAALRRVPVVVVPGFFAAHAEGGLALLGRGGSDSTALYLAALLGSPCRLLKDVDGVFDTDPARAPARRYLKLAFHDAEALGAHVVQPAALELARRHDMPFVVARPGSARGTLVGAESTALAPVERGSPPLRVALLGLGTVGGGVFRHLAARPDLFSMTCVVVRDPARHQAAGVARELLTTDPRRLFARPGDVVVELMGGLELATALIGAALDAGRHVVTANKAVIAEHGPELARLAATRGVTLRHSAAVGGAVPMLERIERIRRTERIARIDAVLNGTSNYVLDRLAEGLPFAEAVREAQRRGFAEADPSLDLDGTDAAQKLAIVSRAAFGVVVDWRAIPRRGISGALPAAVAGRAVRLVASATATESGVRLSVRPVLAPAGHPLGKARGEENAAVIRLAGGRRVVLMGRGAGRWPTAEAVIADLFDLARRRAGSVGSRRSKVERTGVC
jgi:homoserine dehydrogenase